MVYNKSLIVATPSRKDVRYIAAPANVIAEELGNIRQANVVLLGAYLGRHRPAPTGIRRSRTGQPSF